ncbi:hypothetical protein [Prescottella subtropica]|uniref:hypothetical protein n=1 Tax=Prescottella subtropica TaxID=2545757 RepID=UPI0010F8D93F|nr:hypothetical protein [Prescottella subtropica]
MGIKRLAIGAAASVGTLALMGAGIANAVIADPAPGSNFTMCGTVYADSTSTTAADSHPAPDSGIPDSATLVKNVKVEGTLFRSSGATAATYSATTDANGAFCFTGNLSMPPIIANGGHVAFSATTLPSPYTTVVSTSHAGIIDSSAFANHQVGGLLSTKATGFNILVS